MISMLTVDCFGDLCVNKVSAVLVQQSDLKYEKKMYIGTI